MTEADQAAAAAVFPAAKVDKGDATTRAARAIIDKETAERDAKTARLKALRLAKEAADAKAAKPTKTVKPTKTAAPKTAAPKTRKKTADPA